MSSSKCMPSCEVADSILANIAGEDDRALDGVKCSFLSFLFEMCWDVNPGSQCRPSVGKHIRQLAPFYRNTCLTNPCYALFSMSQAVTSTRTRCAPYFDALLKTLLSPNCGKATAAEMEEKERRMTEFKACAEREAQVTCKQETMSFVDTFSKHMSDVCQDAKTAVTGNGQYLSAM